MSEPKQMYGWVMCAHDDPDREEFNDGISKAWIPCGATPCKAYTYRKRPIAPDGKRFSEPDCAWEMVKESELDCVPPHLDWSFFTAKNDWDLLHNRSLITAQAWLSGRHIIAFARRKPAAQQSGWRYFADGAPKDGDYPVLITNGEVLSAANYPDSGIGKGWIAWMKAPPMPPPPPAKSDAELAWEKSQEGQSPYGYDYNIVAKKEFIAGYNAAKSKE